MSKWIEKLSHIIGFTKTETQIILFLLSAFSVGLIISLVKENSKTDNYLEFDYSAEDSLFNAAIGNIEIDDTLTLDPEEKRVASKNELLDFDGGKKKKIEKVNSKATSLFVNINTAGIEELCLLPGIGAKTAENILHYRNKIGKITEADQLLNIKGIGKSKLAKLRKHIKFD